MLRTSMLCSIVALAAACGTQNDKEKPAGKNSDLLGLGEADLVEPQEDGTFKVHCKDGTVEVVTQAQMSKGEVCVPEEPEPEPIPPVVELCGYYSTPLHLKGNDHVITCDVKFEDKVIISAGARILADDAWNVEFLNDVYAYGEIDKPIIFEMSDQSVSQAVRNFRIKGKSNLTYTEDLSYKTGTLLRHVTFPNTLKNIELNKVYGTDLNFIGQQKIDIHYSYIARSNFNLVNLDSLNPTISVYYGSYFIKNVLAGNPTTKTIFYVGNSLAAWNLFETLPSPSSEHHLFDMRTP